MKQPVVNGVSRLSVMIIAGLAVLAGIMLRAVLTAPPALPLTTKTATLLPQAKPLPAVHLQQHSGAEFTLDNALGHWSVLFFGYTYCPDVCPTTLMLLKQVKAQLMQHNPPVSPVQFIFVSIDPVRDTLERLGPYVTYYDPDFIGVTGSAEELQRLTSALGILAVKVPGATPTAPYLMDHSMALIVLNPQAQMQALFSAPTDAAAITADLITLQHYYDSIHSK